MGGRSTDLPADESRQPIVQFEDVSFAYNDDDWVLKDINLAIQPGERIAIVGHTGAGKTSLTSLLLRFYDLEQGRITIDGDTSTNDTALLMASGVSGIEIVKPAQRNAVQSVLDDVLVSLAKWLIKVGEGATKLVEITVKGAAADQAALRIADTVANSNLTKTALFGEDANWGRVVMAVGKAGEPADRDRLAISFGDVRVAVDGERDPDYDEDAASAVMVHDEITITIDVGIGSGRARVWTCDLTKEYVEIL